MFWKKSKLSLTALGGGVNYVGHNCFLASDGYNAVVLDCGIKPGTRQESEQSAEAWRDPPTRLDILDEVRGKTIGVISHAHLDHIGAVSELIYRNIPVYLSQESRPFAARYAETLRIPEDARFHTFSRKNILKNGNLEVSFFPVHHSIPGTHAVLIKSGKKSILYLPDFKFNGMRGSLQDSRAVFREIRNRAGTINCLVMDILNAEMEGFTPPEQLVLNSINNVVRTARGRVFITFFSSNIGRMAGILDIARSHHRRVGVSGWGMSASYEQLTGRRSRRNGDVILLSGSQGEENSGLVRITQGEHRFISLSRRDTVINSARCIPDNEEAVRESLEGLRSQGARILLHHGEGRKLNLTFKPEEGFFHVSGHEQRGGLQEVKKILEPELIIPFHAPPDRYEIFEKFVGGNKTKRLQIGETLEI